MRFLNSLIALQNKLLLPLLCLTYLLLTVSAWAEPSSAEKLADEIAITELPANEPAELQPAAPKKAEKSKAVTISALDVAAKTASIILVVYALAWGLKLVQRKGFKFTLHQTESIASPRLKQCAHLPLQGGAGLYMIEMDGQTVLIATQVNGEVHLLLAPEVAAKIEPVSQPAPAPVAVISEASSLANADDEWQQRREVLIRALAGQNAMS